MIISYDKTSKDSILDHARSMIGRSLRGVIPAKQLPEQNESAGPYEEDAKEHKGLFGNLVEKYVFGIEPNSRPGPDFLEAGIELKTTPLKKHPTHLYSAKERLVFSKIDYKNVAGEKWETSSFLRKNKLLLLMFYLYEKDASKLDYLFKIVRLLSLLKEVPSEDILQIQKDWQYIIDRVKNGKAHLLSEGDTFYLGACTKSALGTDLTDQAVPGAPKAKPRAFSLKQSYLNYIIQDSLKMKIFTESLYKDKSVKRTIEEYVQDAFHPYIGKKATVLKDELALNFNKKPKNYYQILAKMILGVKKKRVLEFEKANITMKVIALEPSGKLRESISFPYFDYREIVDEDWEESGLYQQLSSKRFLFVIFQKVDSGDAVLKEVKFWNFPIEAMDTAKEVWERTVKQIKNEKYDEFVKISDNMMLHVRPHARNSQDRILTPSGNMEFKRSFWLNAKFIQDQIGVS